MAGTGNEPDDAGVSRSGEYKRPNYLNRSNSGVFSVSPRVFRILGQRLQGMTLKGWQGEMNRPFFPFFFVSLENRKSLKMLPPNGKRRRGGAVLGNAEPKPRFHPPGWEWR